jgi:hypothetical protein
MTMASAIRRLGLRAIAITLTACVSIALLSGCWERSAPPSQTLSVRLAEDGPEFVICEEMHVRVILVEYKEPGEIWVVSVDEAVDQRAEAGDRLHLPDPKALPDLESLVDGTTLHVLVNDGERVAESEWVLERGALGEQWFRPDGSHSPEPCQDVIPTLSRGA